MKFQAFAIEDQRLRILQILAQDPQYSHNSGVLQTALGALGHGVSLDRVRSLLDWLAEQDLVEVTGVAGLQVGRLTTRGLDVAQGRATAPGVARIRPEE